MKTYILNTLERVKQYSKQLDAQSILYDKSWEVFNDTGEKEVMIFRSNNELIISRNGLVQKGKWELLSISSIIIDVDNKSYLLNTAFVDNKFLAMLLDGTNESMIMIEPEMKKQLLLDSISKVENYLVGKYIVPELERKKKEEEERQKLKLIQSIEAEKREREEERRRLEVIKNREDEKREKEALEREREEDEKKVNYIVNRYKVRAIILSSFITLTVIIGFYHFINEESLAGKIVLTLLGSEIFLSSIWFVFMYIFMPKFMSAFMKTKKGESIRSVSFVFIIFQIITILIILYVKKII